MIIILDFGSQYTQLIARKVRELQVYCEILPYNSKIFDDKNYKENIKGIILSGGPDSVYDKNAAKLSEDFFENIFRHKIPVLGICYGMQLITHNFKGKVEKGKVHEYGLSKIKIVKDNLLFSGLPKEFNVWMSHGDTIINPPIDFQINAKTTNNLIAAMQNTILNIYTLQFHPEVKHTDYGSQIIKNFLFRICKEKKSWKMYKFVDEQTKEIKKQVQNNHVICALSGGVDSSVVSLLVYKAIGKQLHCVFIDNGLLRENEKERVKRIFYPIFRENLYIIDAQDIFLKRLKNIIDPELKRKIIGKTFIEIFEKTAKTIERKISKNISYLVQGTLYPDVIESVSVKGPSQTIKTHHNVGGLPKKMNFKLIEPLKYLFKDEVRKLGEELGLTDEILFRHPFPGPGLAVRIIGSVSKDKLSILRKADLIVEEEIIKSGLYKKIWQSFAVLLPIKTVGIMGDKRTYENVVALRVVESKDAMTADWYKLPYEVLTNISNRIINEVRGVNRVVFDISSKPPATIEWE